MMTLYALLFALLSFPASAWEPEVYNSVCPEDGISMTAIEALPRLEDYAIFLIDADDTTVANATVPNYDYAVDFDAIDQTLTDDYTAAVASPASKPRIVAPIDFSVDDEGWDFKLPATIDHSIEANAW